MSPRILAVDDEEDVLDLIYIILRQHGLEMIPAASGMEALEWLAHDLPDLVMLDVMMPDMDGFEVCRHIRADQRTAHLPVMMLTARAQPESRVEAFRAGADDYVTKPVYPDELVARLQAILEHAASALESKEGRAISVVGVKGGVGVTTLAVNLALALSVQARTILADLEGGGTAADHLGLNRSHRLDNLLTLDAEAIDRAGVEAALVAHPSGLRLLTAAEGPVDAARTRATLGRLLALCDVCVFDLGSRLGQANLAIAQRSRNVIVVLDSDRVTLMQARRMLQALKQARLPEPATKIVCINRLGLSTETIRGTLATTLGCDPAAIIGPAGEALHEAMEQGQPLAVRQPDHPFVVEMHALAARLMNAA